MASDAKPTVHRGVALMLCENEAILEETMVSIDTTELDIQRIGGRAIVAPAYQLEAIREALQQRGTFPKVVGDIVTLEQLEAEAAAEEAEQAETSEQQEDE